MYKLFAVFVLFSSQAYTCSIQDTELVFTFMVNRQGDRTPFKHLLKLSNVFTQLEKLMKPLGLDKMTDDDKDQFYQLGKYIRGQYGSLLTPAFDPGNLFARTSFCNPSITSTLMVLTGIYNLEKEQWMETMNWTPLAYSTVLPKYDYNAAFINCPAFIKKSANPPLLTGVLAKLLSTFQHVFDELGQLLGITIAHAGHAMDTLLSIPIIYDLIKLGLPCDSSIQKLMPEIKLLAGHCLNMLLGNPKVLPLQSGVLLNEFFRMAELAQSGGQFPKVYLHSAYDFNLYSLLAATKATPNPGPPPYGSLYSLEFRKEIPTGKYFVLPVYVTQPGNSTYLTVDGCGDIFCEYNLFKSLTSPYAMDISKWRSQCGWSNSMDLNSCSLE